MMQIWIKQFPDPISSMNMDSNFKLQAMDLWLDLLYYDYYNLNSWLVVWLGEIQFECIHLSPEMDLRSQDLLLLKKQKN